MKKKLHKIRKKVNNAGMTLIEILVAMTLLVVAIIPLSGGFIYSATNSAKAKHMQQTAVLANTMIENCKAYNVDMIKEMVLDGSFMPNATSSVQDTSFTAGSYLYYFDDVVVYSDAATGYESAIVYDVSMKIEPMGNPKKIMDYSDINKYSDAVFIVNETPVDGDTFTAKECDAKAYQNGLELMAAKVNAKISENGWNHALFTYTDIETSMISGDNAGEKLKLTRTIYVDANKDDVTGEETVVVKYKYAYNFTGGDFEFRDSVTNQMRPVDVSSLTDKEYEFPIYDNTALGDGTLENVYLFYYPSYNPTGIVFEQDEIVIDNSNFTDGYDVYIMKQPRSDFNVSELNTKESGYAPKVTVNGIYDTDVYHNLNVNLGGGGTTGSLNTATHVIWKDYNYNNPDPSDPAYDPNYKSLINEEYKKMMFTVEVAVYPKDAYGVSGGVMGMSEDALCTLDGTFLNW